MLSSILTVAGTGAVLYGLYVVRNATVSNQEKLNNITTQLGAIQGHFAKGIREVVSEIAKLQAQNAELDFTGLETAVSSLQVAADALDTIVPDEIEAEEPETPETPETSEPAPAPVPSDTDTEAPEPESDPWGADVDAEPVDQETPRN